MVLIIDYSNLAMSHTIGPEGFNPAILAFGVNPRLSIGNWDQMTQTVANWMHLMSKARREYEAIVSQLRLRRATTYATLNEAVLDITPGNEVLVFREKQGWGSPYTFLYWDEILSIVLDEKGREHLFHSTMIKPYQRPKLPIRNLLNRTDADPDTNIRTHHVQIVHYKRDPRFLESIQKDSLIYCANNLSKIKTIITIKAYRRLSPGQDDRIKKFHFPITFQYYSNLEMMKSNEYFWGNEERVITYQKSS